MILRLACLTVIAFTCFTVSRCAAMDDRVEWHYQVPAGLRRIVWDGESDWRLHLPNGTTAKLVELDRTDDFVELENSDNKNVMRLFDDHGEIRKEQGKTFNRFTDGSWEVGSGSAPEPAYEIRLVYFVPSDRQPVADYEDKIRNVATLMAEVMTADLRSKSYQTDGPPWVQSGGKIGITLVKGDKPSMSYNQGGAWKSSDHADAVFDEVDRQLGSSNQQISLIFAETYEPDPAPKLWPGHIALAIAKPPRGGIAVFSAWILRDEFASADMDVMRQRFFDDTPYPGRTALGDKGPNSPRSDFMEDGVGGALHELGHLFGLPHHGLGKPNHIMSQGFRNLRWNVGPRKNARMAAEFSDENAAMLMTSRYLNSAVDRTDNEQPSATLELARQGPSLYARVKASDDRELALLAIVEVTESAGRELVGSQKLMGTEQTVTLKIPVTGRRDGSVQIQAMIVDRGGNFRKVEQTFR